MTSKVVTSQQLGQVLLDRNFEYLVVLPGFSLRTSGDTVVASAIRNRITNQGFIVSASENPNASSYSAIELSGSLGALDNAGTISGLDRAGVALSGYSLPGGNTVSNRGSIFGQDYGIKLQARDPSIVNSGTIEGGNVGIGGSALNSVRVLNTGLIIGNDAALNFILTEEGSVYLENAGTIAGGGRLAMLGGLLSDEVLNSGAMLGQVRLYSGNDLYDGRLGRVTGAVDGEFGDDTILGGAGGETLKGGFGDDEILGAGGNDVIDGGTGSDRLDGGEGFDLVSYIGLLGPVLVDLQSANQNEGDAADDALLNFEGVIGTGGADTLLGDTAANELRGGLGNDVLDGRAGTDTMRGGAGNDLMTVDIAGDLIIERTGEGADTVVAAVSYRLASNAEVEFLTTPNTAGTTAINLIGSNTANAILGNAAGNRLTGLGGADSLSGLAGADLLYGGDGNDTLLGDVGDDQLFGDAGADSLDGGEGNDRLTGGDGNDALSGMAGADLLYGGNGNDTLLGDVGDDQLFGDADADSLDGGDGNDRLTGGDGNDALSGMAGNDVLTGGAGTDTLLGGDGNDRLLGGTNAGLSDWLTGGAGSDIFVLDAGGSAVIKDFTTGVDKIHITQALAPGLALGSLAAANFFSPPGVAPSGPQILVVSPGYAPSLRSVSFDPDGPGGQPDVYIALLEGIGSGVISASDFVIIA
jgi:Ca2+-binding RTX toxin-like protein